MKFQRSTRWMAAIALAVAVACTHEQRVETEETAEEVAEETGEAAEAVAEETVEAADAVEDMIDDEVTVDLTARGASSVSGNADLRESGDSWRVEIELQGLTAGATYGAAVHEGGCAASGDRVAPLEAPTAAAGGSTSTVNRSTFRAGTDYSIVITGVGGGTVACGELPPVSTEIG